VDVHDPSIPLPLDVAVTDARLVFAGAPLFDGMALTLAAGTWTCLLGPSGIGKTSLLRLILGLDVDDGGVRVRCSDHRPLAQRAAYMAQRDLLLPWLNVVDNVMLGLRLRSRRPTAADRRRALSLLSAVGLADRHGDRPDTLSGGMRQRAALARTLFEDRPVVLMDEPFSAVDAITRARLQDLAARLLAGRTVLLVTHDPLEALRLGHHIHVMSGRPATLDRPIVPTTPPPRPVVDRRLLTLHGELLRRLAEAAS
jgi:putative hydroxymethylpyrimidine transport system ATP-binding protein